jgi:hypothetical protein
MISEDHYREAVTQQSPRLPRVAVSLGKHASDTNPTGVVPVSQLKGVGIRRVTRKDGASRYHVTD